ncbi:MAG TPA: response regulator [Candidatus Moranbacteria bacterium]|nr:response regulator [Candidatus Moranbacteria bacterium]
MSVVGINSSPNSLSQDNELIDMGHDLLTPTSTIIAYTEMLLEYANVHIVEPGFISDLNKVLSAGEQLSNLITQLFSKKSVSQGEIDLNNITSEIRHNLRTPINAIIGYGEMLLEDMDAEEHKDAILDLQKILNSARRLLTLIGDLSYLSKRSNQPQNEEVSNIGMVKSEKPEKPAFKINKVAKSSLETDKIDIHNITIEDDINYLSQNASLLVVDDGENNRELLSRRLKKEGFEVEEAENGLQALEKIRDKKFDLVLLDIIMPEINGYQVLEAIKTDEYLTQIPVIMISALDEIDSVVHCIEMGAEDYLQKPFNQVILNAKISATLERKRLRDRELAFLKKLQIEQEKSEKLLLNILPKAIADRLKVGVHTIADKFEDVTVLFSDLVGFTELSAGVSASDLVEKLNQIFIAFDRLTKKHGLEKIKTIGDAYMLVGGLPTQRDDHVEAVADMAIEMLDEIAWLNEQNQEDFKIRIGMHTGPVVAGVIGKHKFNYDLWGDTVNTASRMESHGIPDEIQVSKIVYDRLKDKFFLEERGLIEIKGKGKMNTYLLKGRRN